jgi:RimJ/RimL family protein N-acetyltransferase
MIPDNREPIIEIQTPRLILRPPKIADLDVLKAAIDASVDEIAPWLEWAKPDLSKDVLRSFFNYAAACHAEEKPHNLFFSIFDKSNDQFIGDVYYGNIDWTVPYFAIGYWIDSRLSRKGYMLEAVNALTRLGLSYFKAQRIEISMSALNFPSKKIPEKLGFDFEGELKNRHINFVTKAVCNTSMYSCCDIEKLPPLKIEWFTD